MKKSCLCKKLSQFSWWTWLASGSWHSCGRPISVAHTCLYGLCCWQRICVTNIQFYIPGSENHICLVKTNLCFRNLGKGSMSMKLNFRLQWSSLTSGLSIPSLFLYLFLISVAQTTISHIMCKSWEFTIDIHYSYFHWNINSMRGGVSVHVIHKSIVNARTELITASTLIYFWVNNKFPI